MKQTSILAHESIKPSKEFLHSKILAGLKKIKKGTFREIAKASNLDEQQKVFTTIKREPKHTKRD